MNCKRCGAFVVDKFCSHCGTRVRTDLQEYRLFEKKAAKSFKQECEEYRAPGESLLLVNHLSEACWQASNARYGIRRKLDVGYTLSQADIDNLETIRIHAMLLFRQLISF